MFDTKPYSLDRVVRLILSVGAFFLVLYVLGYLSDVLLPFAISAVIAYLINPLVTYVEKYIKHRALSVVCSLLLIFIIIFVAGKIIIPMVSSELTRMSKLLVAVATDSTLGRKAAEWIPNDIWQWFKNFIQQDNIKSWLQNLNLPSIANAIFQKIAPGVWGILTGTAHALAGLLGLVATMMYLFFILVDYNRLRLAWPEMLPENIKVTIQAFLKEFIYHMNVYFRAQILLATIITILYAVGFSIIGLPLAIPLALLMGALNLIPYMQVLAFPIVFLLAILHTLDATGITLGMTLFYSFIVIGAAQIIQDWILAPKIIGKAMGLRPAIMLLSLSIWGKVLGFLGLIIAIPLTCLVIVFYKQYLSSLKHRRLE